MFVSLSTLLHVLAASAASIPFVAAQTEITTDELYGNLVSTAAPAPGFNGEGKSVFTNYVNAVNDGQFFLLTTGSWVYEKPGTELVQLTFLDWCSDLTSSDLSNSSIIGYAARCVQTALAGHDDAVAAGAQRRTANSGGEFSYTTGISTVFVEHLNSFQSQKHENADDHVFRFWDDGQKTVPMIAWEGHDEGDMSPNAATASWSSFGEVTFMSVEEVAQLLNTAVEDFSLEKFNQVYKDTWVKEHEDEVASENPNAEAEQEIIDEVKGETDSTGETTSPAESGTGDGGSGSDPATPIEDDSAGNGRKLASVVARFVSASLRVFGI